MSMDAQSFSQLVEVAKRAKENSYSPYSRFAVGAALLSASGKIYGGCNVENASYGLTLCAERVACAKAISEGERDFHALVIFSIPPVPPCGACLQFLAQFVPSDFLIISTDGTTKREWRFSQIFPQPFRLNP